MLGAKNLYWIAQLVGWSSYIVFAIILNVLLDKEIERPEILALVTVWILGLFISHLFRYVILRYHWLNLRIERIIPRLITAAIIASLLFEAFYSGLLFVFTSNIHLFDSEVLLQDILSWSLLFLFWSLIYFFYHFFKNYKKEEIKNLQLEAAHNEFQINRLRSQLNPHFIFNAMNSIRSLIDENPIKAKKAVTQLSNVLRNSLLMDKKKLISIKDEIALVKDYLEIEKARYEDRLRVTWEVSASNEERLIPPLLLQTLVENAIKHGISKLPEGGDLNIALECVPEGCKILVSNSGAITSQSIDGTGFGLASTRERLELIYQDEARFELYQKDAKVFAKLFIPIKSKIHSL